MYFISNYNENLQDLSVDILEMMNSGKVNVSALVSHEYKIDDIEEAIGMAGKSTIAQKVCISYQ